MTPVKDWSLPCPRLLLPVDVLVRGCSCPSMSLPVVALARRWSSMSSSMVGNVVVDGRRCRRRWSAMLMASCLFLSVDVVVDGRRCRRRWSSKSSSMSSSKIDQGLPLLLRVQRSSLACNGCSCLPCNGCSCLPCNGCSCPWLLLSGGRRWSAMGRRWSFLSVDVVVVVGRCRGADDSCS